MSEDFTKREQPSQEMLDLIAGLRPNIFPGDRPNISRQEWSQTLEELERTRQLLQLANERIQQLSRKVYRHRRPGRKP